MLPNFLICGTAAAGTSYLSSVMIQHPEIYLPREMRPEPHYFYYKWKFAHPISWYESTWFSEVQDEKAIGERSSSYMFGKRVAENIHTCLPDVKLIFMLRNPIERTFANYRYTVLEGLEELSFEEALKHEADRIKAQQGIWAEVQPYNYTGRGFYFEQLQRFLRLFDKRQMLLLRSDYVSKHPSENFERLFQFLDIDDTFVPTIPPDFTSLSVKERAVQVKARGYFGDLFDTLVETIRREEDPSSLVHSEEDRSMFNLLKENLKCVKEDMSAESRAYLQRLFEEDMGKLQGIVDFSTADWQ